MSYLANFFFFNLKAFNKLILIYRNPFWKIFFENVLKGPFRPLCTALCKQTASSKMVILIIHHHKENRYVCFFLSLCYKIPFVIIQTANFGVMNDTAMPKLNAIFCKQKRPLTLSLNEFGDIWTKFLWDICSVQRVLSFEGGLPFLNKKLFQKSMQLLFIYCVNTVNRLRQNISNLVAWFK